MASSVSGACKSCGHIFSYNYGCGFHFIIMHCDQCGAEKRILFDHLSKMVEHGNSEYGTVKYDKCECGGVFTLSAKPRCHICHSTKIEIDDSCEMLFD